MICDFCSDPAPNDPEHTVFTSEPVIYSIDNVKYVDSVDWAVCDACLPLIKSRDKEGIIQRALDGFNKYHGGYNAAQIVMLRFHHNRFWELYVPT